MRIDLPTVELSGRYRIVKYRGDTATYESGWFDNLIVDKGLNQISNVALGTGGVPYLFKQAFVGTGDTTVSVSDISLDRYLASSDVVESTGTKSYVADSPPYWRYIRTYTFAVGTATGLLSEVGVGTTKDLLFSRALITDSFGVVNTVKVLSDESVQLVYELRSYINPGDVNKTITITGNIPNLTASYAVTIRPASITSAKDINIGVGYSHTNVALYSGVIQNNTLVPLGSSTSLTSYVAPNTYVNGTFISTVDFSFTTTSGNYAGGVNAVRVTNSQCDFQIGFVPPINKDSTKALSLEFIFAYGRYTP